MEKKRPARRPAAATGACRRCGSTSAAPFGADGICLRCAGARALALEVEGATAEAPAAGANPAENRGDLPARIGDCEIIEELGRGGMARVFAARQLGLGRIVAVKAIAAGGGRTADLELRFLREVQMVARLRHPNIVAIHDSGRANGYVYFSMDYIEGGDLGRRLRAGPVAPRRAAELLRKVAMALAYTHAEGVLHRDLKPSNILLDGDEPRVADFGLAAPLESGGDLTAVSGLLGTPHYVAPEALRKGSAALGVASDVYAMGVILFEMLTGRTPFAGALPGELATLMEQRDPPAPRLLAPATPRDLETICLKCLEREPARRYPSAAALADDLGHFLAGEAIMARTPGVWARWRKFASRHRTLVATTTGVALTLIGATAVSASLAVRATRAERRAADAAATSRELADFLQNDLLAQAQPEQGADRDLKLRTVLDRAGRRIGGRFADRPLTEAALRETLGRTYASLGDYAAAQTNLVRAWTLRQTVLGRAAPATLTAMSLVADNLIDQNKLAEAERLGAQTLALERRALGARDLATLHTMDNLARVLRYRDRLPQAEPLQRAALAARESVQGARHPDLLDALDNLALIDLRVSKLDEAKQLAERAAANETAARGPEHPDTLAALNNLSVVYRQIGRAADTERICRQILSIRERQLGPDHHDTLVTLINLGLAYRTEKKYPEAEAAYRRAAEGLARTLGPDHRDTLIALSNLALVERDEGKVDDALTLMRQVLATRERVLGPDHAETLNTLDGIGSMLMRQGRFAEAEPVLRSAWDIRRRTVPLHWLTPASACQLGYALLKLGRFAEAEPLVVQGYREFLARREQVPPVSRPLLKEAGDAIIELYTAWGRPAQAEAWRAKLSAAAAGRVSL